MISVNDALGERAEDSKRVILPESYYPVQLSIGALGTTDLRMDDVKDAQGNKVIDSATGQPLQEEKGGVPFVEATASVYDGPFAGIDVQQKLYFSPGKKGGGLGLYLGATKAITHTGANTLAVCGTFGVPLPSQGNMNPKEFSTAIRAAIADAFFTFEPAKRLDFVAKLLNLAAWDNKKIVVKLKVETRNYTKDDGTPGAFSSNQMNGFYALDDKDKGVAWVRAHEFESQQEAYDAMSAAGLL
jgi:hypothetical protein